MIVHENDFLFKLMGIKKKLIVFLWNIEIWEIF
jgi:hypothetical protein